MKELTKLRIFAGLLIVVIFLTGYFLKDKLPKESEISIFQRYYLHR